MESKKTMIETKNRKGQKGVTTVEYAVMLVLVAIAVATATPSIKTAVLSVFTATSSALGS